MHNEAMAIIVIIGGKSRQFHIDCNVSSNKLTSTEKLLKEHIYISIQK